MADPGQNAANASSRYFLAGLAVVLVLLTVVSDLNPSAGSSGVAKAESLSPSSPKEIPTPKYASMMAGPSIKFLYCYS